MRTFIVVAFLVGINIFSHPLLSPGRKLVRQIDLILEGYAGTKPQVCQISTTKAF